MKNATDMSQIVLPIVHLNGTPAERIIEARSNAYDALQSALKAFREVAPNGRDYYPEPGRMEKSVEQHKRRCEAIHGLMDELEYEIYELEQNRR